MSTPAYQNHPPENPKVWTGRNVLAKTAKARPISAPCSDRFRAAHDEGARGQEALRYIVLHSTETPANTAEGVAYYFALPGSGGSANLVLDDRSCFRTVPDLVIPWGAPPLNLSGFHIESCGFSYWSRARWFTHPRLLRRLAYKMALRSVWFEIPLRFVGADELKRLGIHPGHGRGGVTTHAEVSKAFGQTNHTDPGAGFPVSLVLRLARHYAKGMGKP